VRRASSKLVRSTFEGRVSPNQGHSACCTPAEAPIDRCATILESARYGVGLDREDVVDMTASADAASHCAPRARLARPARRVDALAVDLANALSQLPMVTGTCARMVIL
jgi:hypothetical protein